MESSDLKDDKNHQRSGFEKSFGTGKSHRRKLNTETHLYMAVEWNDVKNDSA